MAQTHEEHKAKMRAAQRALRLKRQAAGQCPCGAPRAPGGRLCLKCREVKRRMNRERADGGRCIQCGDPPVPGRLRCAKHARAGADANALRRLRLKRQRRAA